MQREIYTMKLETERTLQEATIDELSKHLWEKDKLIIIYTMIGKDFIFITSFNKKLNEWLE